MPSSSAKRKIVVVINGLDVGGAEMDLVRNLPLINRERFAISVYVFSHQGPLAAEMARQGIAVVGSNQPLKGSRVKGRFKLFADCVRAIGYITKLALYLRKEKPDVMHAVLPHSYAIGIAASLLAGVRFRVMSRLSLSFYHTKVIRFVELRLLHPFCSLAIGNSERILEQLQAEGIAKERCFLLYNGIDPRPFASDITKRAAVRNEFSIGADSFVMCTVANLHKYKGHQEVLAALHQAAQDLPEKWTWLVVGRDENGNKALYETWLKEHNMQANVIFTGPRPDVAALLQASDLFILASHHEGLPNSILEAMASALPVVATQVGGIPELILGAENGILVPAHNPQALAAAIIKLASAQELRLKMGQANRQRVLAHFSLAQSVAKYEQAYSLA